METLQWLTLRGETHYWSDFTVWAKISVKINKSGTSVLSSTAFNIPKAQICFQEIWRKERQRISVLWELCKGQSDLKQKQVSEERHFIWKRLISVFKTIHNWQVVHSKHLKDSHSDKWIFLSLFSSETIFKIPAEKLYGIISFDSYAIVYM